MGDLERLKKVYGVSIAFMIISGIVHIFYAIRFFTAISFLIESSFQDGVDAAYIISLIIFALLILIVVIIRAIRKDVTEEINYLYSEIRNLEKLLRHRENPRPIKSDAPSFLESDKIIK